MALSYLGVARNMKVKISTKRCGICDDTFWLPKGKIVVNDFDISQWSLDAGGYCPVCHKYMCPKHAKFVPNSTAHKQEPEFRYISVVSEEKPISQSDKNVYEWVIGCKKCGSKLFPSRWQSRLGK